MTTENDLTCYLFQSVPVRVHLDEEKNPWFVAADVASVLEHRDSDRITRLLDDDEKGTHKVSTPGGDQDVSIISESGLYTIIIRSNKPQAKPFRRWVTHEVLPAIRRHGRYIHGRREPGRPEQVAPPSLQRLLARFTKAVRELRALGQDKRQAMLTANEILIQRWGDDGDALRLLRITPPEHGALPPRTDAPIATVLRFIDSCLQLEPGAMVAQRDLYRAYLGWCSEENYRPLGKNSLSNHVCGILRLSTCRPGEKINPDRVRFLRGVRIAATTN